MANSGAVVVIGGTSVFGIGVGQHYAAQGRRVYVTSRDQSRADDAAQEVGGDCIGFTLDLGQPYDIADALSVVEGEVDHIVITSVDRDENKVREYNLDGAINLTMMKLVGYIEVIHMLLPHMGDSGSIVLYGGLAKERPYVGSTTVSTVNGGVTTMVHTMAVELAPIRVNAIHPAVVGDSPYWANKPPEVLENLRKRTPLGKLVSIDDVVDATIFLLENRSITGVNLNIDGGWLLM
jgi:NAD(P)-dependent dehydrogenase (short-subunit alcohol dehydrogenase family)